MHELQLLGGLGLKGPDGRELSSVLSHPKRVAVLSYLVLTAPGGLLSRDRLLALFWPDADSPHARNALSQVLHGLRRSLGDEVILTRGNHEVGVSQEHLRCDALLFQKAAKANEPKEALRLYSGHLLPGFHLDGDGEFERWLEEERERLREMAARTAWAAAHLSLETGELTEAERTAQKALTLVCTDENEVRRFIEALERAGDRAAALRLYEKFRHKLEEELEVEASPETKSLVAAIRARDEPYSVARNTGVLEATEPFPELLNEPSRPHPTGKWSASRSVPAAVVVILALFGIYIGFLWGGGSTLASNRVLVIIFENQTGDASLDPIGRMATELAIGELVATGVAEVLPMETALLLYLDPEYGTERIGEDRPVASMAEETGARIVISGSYFAQGDSVVVQARIIDARRARVLRAIEPTPVPIREPGRGLADLAQSLAASVGSHFDPRWSAIAANHSAPPSFSAYREYSAGMDAFVDQDMKRALPHFHRAAEIDANYLAPVLKAVATHRNMGQPRQADSLLRTVEKWDDQASPMEREALRFNRAAIDGDRTASYRAARRRAEVAPNPGTLYQQAREARKTNRPREAVQILIDLDPAGPVLKGWTSYWGEIGSAYHLLGEYEEELKQARRGRRQYPDKLGGLFREARALAALGRTDEVLALAREILSRWPHPSNLWVAALELRAHGHVDVANEVLDTMFARYGALPLEDTATLPYRQWFGETLYLMERWHEAQSLFGDLASERPDDVVYLGYLGSLAARAGNPDGAQRISEQLRDLDQPYLWGKHTYRRAKIAAVLGEKDEAVSLLHQAHGEGWSYGAGLHRDIDFETLRGYPPFEAFLRPKG